QVAVAFWHLLVAKEGFLRPVERGGFDPPPMFRVSVGERKVGAVLMASVGKGTPIPVERGTRLEDREGTTSNRLPVLVDKHKRFVWTWVLKVGLAQNELGIDPIR